MEGSSSYETTVKTVQEHGEEVVEDIVKTVQEDENAKTTFRPGFEQLLPELLQITDRYGNQFYVGDAGEFWHPPFPIGANNDYKTHLRQIQEMEVRPDDVMICSYPKTGVHWQQELVYMLLHKTTDMRPEGERAFCFIDFLSVDSFKDVASPRILVTHEPFRYLPKQAFQKRIKILYLERNPKDVLVSYYCQLSRHSYPLNFPGTFEHFVHLNLESGWVYGHMFDYLLEWQEGKDNATLPICTSLYEDMKRDSIGGVKKFNEFLETGCDDELCERIALACDFDKMKVHKDSTCPPGLSVMFKDKKLAFYRKGDIGDWKNWFTVSLNELFDREYKNRMSGYKTVFTFE